MFKQKIVINLVFPMEIEMESKMPMEQGSHLVYYVINVNIYFIHDVK